MLVIEQTFLNIFDILKTEFDQRLGILMSGLSFLTDKFCIFTIHKMAFDFNFLIGFC